MIRTVTFRSRLDGKDGELVTRAIQEHVSRLVRDRNTLRGVRVNIQGEVIDVSLRMSGVDRWRIARDAKKTASYILASQRLPYSRPLVPVSEVTEESARNLTKAEGRTPQSVLGGRGRRSRPAASAPSTS